MKTQVCQKLIFLFLISIFVSGCNTGTKKTANNHITFDSISIDNTYHLLGNPENPNCNLQINFIYPANYENEDVLKKIQKLFVSSYFGDDYESLSPEGAIAKYAEDYLNNYKELEEEYKAEIAKVDEERVGAWFSYYETSSNDIAYNKNDILSYTVNFGEYTGGAHGAHSYTNHVIDLKTGELITEDDIFVDGFQEDLAQILVDRIAKENSVEKAKELENIGFFSIEEIFPNGNFLVNDTDITYTFNEYEIAAYVVGATNVHLPYEEIQHLLKKESPISHLIGN